MKCAEQFLRPVRYVGNITESRGCATVVNREKKMKWLIEKSREVLRTEGTWLHAKAVAERIASRYHDPTFFWNEKSVTAALRVMHARSEVDKKAISGRQHYRLT